MPAFRSKILAAAGALLVGVATAATGLPAGAALTPSAHRLHPLGARPPSHFVAVRNTALGMSAQDVLPVSVNLRAYAVPVGDQGYVGSCVAWAIDYGMLGWYSKKLGRAGQPFAPMYVYSQINVGRNVGQDWGSYPTDALSVLQSQGSDTQAHYSHDNYDWRDAPNAGEIANAAHYKISNWHTLFAGAGQATSATAIKTALAAGHPVAIELPVRPGFDNMGSSSNAVDADYTGSIRGYHEILGVGYDAAGLIVQNSWGTGWGMAGFGRLSWDVVTHDVAEADDMDGLAPDSAAPAVLSVNTAAVATGSISATTIPYKVSWTSVGTVASYTVSYTVNGGASVPVTLTSVRAASYVFNAAPGATYRFSVQATGTLGQQSAVVTSAPFTPSLVQETDNSIFYGGNWTSTVYALASGGHVKATAQANANATFTTSSARTISWIATKAATRGSAKIYVDGVLRATVSLYAATTFKSLAYTIDFGSDGAHTIEIVNVGTVGHPSIDVDAFAVTS
jgi:hypothetical protein